MTQDEIYNFIRKAFHSQSGLYLNPKESYEITLKIEEVLNNREKLYNREK